MKSPIGAANHPIPVSRSVNWLKPYLEIAELIMPNLGHLKRITARKPKRLEDVEAAELVKTGPNAFKMTLFSGVWHTDAETGVSKFEPYTKMELVRAFAHELAHMAMSIKPGQHWKLHHPEHRIFQNELDTLFLHKMIENGYHTEEDETAEFL